MTEPGRLTADQWEELLAPLDASRIDKNDSGQSFLPHWDVRRRLISIFGFGGYDLETLSLEKTAETKHANGVYVVYAAQVRLTIKDPEGRVVAQYDDAGAGGANGYFNPQPRDNRVDQAYHNAMTGALSQALNRCVNNLGDQFGLSLYNKGSIDPVVGSTLLDPAAANIPTQREDEDELLKEALESDYTADPEEVP